MTKSQFTQLLAYVTPHRGVLVLAVLLMVVRLAAGAPERIRPGSPASSDWMTRPWIVPTSWVTAAAVSGGGEAPVPSQEYLALSYVPGEDSHI